MGDHLWWNNIWCWCVTLSVLDTSMVCHPLQASLVDAGPSMVVNIWCWCVALSVLDIYGRPSPTSLTCWWGTIYGGKYMMLVCDTLCARHLWSAIPYKPHLLMGDHLWWNNIWCWCVTFSVLDTSMVCYSLQASLVDAGPSMVVNIWCWCVALSMLDIYGHPSPTSLTCWRRAIYGDKYMMLVCGTLCARHLWSAIPYKPHLLMGDHLWW